MPESVVGRWQLPEIRGSYTHNQRVERVDDMAESTTDSQRLGAN